MPAPEHGDSSVAQLSGNGAGRGQLSLFDRGDAAAAARARAEGIGNADAHADPTWRRWAFVAVLHCASELPDFTADDVWLWLLDHVPAAHTHEPAALGPVMQKAATRGWIAKTGELRPSRLKRRHRDLTVWRGKPTSHGSTE